MMKRTRLKARRRHRIRRLWHRIRIRLIICAVILLVVFIGGGLLARIPALQMTDITVSGVDTIDENQIKLVARNTIAGEYLWLYPKRNRILYPREALRTQLQERYPRIKQTTITTDEHMLHISVTEYTGMYLWCGETIPHKPQTISETDCYFVAEDGFVFAEAPYFSGDVFFRFYGGEVASDAPIGSRVLAPQSFHELVAFKNFLPEIGITSATVFLQDGGPYELYLDPLDDPAPLARILFSPDDSFSNIIVRLHTVLTTEPLDEQFETAFDRLEYIDLRYGNQVFYKFQE